MTDCAEVVAEAFLDAYTRYPPFDVLLTYSVICEQFPLDQKLATGLLSILDAVNASMPNSYKVTFPELYRQKETFHDGKSSGMSIPLYEVVNVPKILIEILYQFYRVLGDEGYEIRKKLQDNENAIFGLSQYARRQKGVPLPTSVDMEPEELAWAYLKGTPFERLFNTQVPFVIPRKTFASHCIILGPPNHGKSQLISSLAASFLSDNDNPPGLFVLDPHGDLFSTLAPRVSPERLILLNPDVSPPALNFLDFGTSTEAQTLQTFSYLMSSLSGGLSEKGAAVVPYTLKLLRKIKEMTGEASIETLRIMMDEKVKKWSQSSFRDSIAQLNTVDRGFFETQFYGSGDMERTKSAIAWRLYSALSSDAFREMFSAKTNSFDADAAMRERKVVLVKGARGSLGDEGMKVFLQFIVAQFFSAALRREAVHPSKRFLCLLFADEAHHVFNSQTSNILTECRKYGLGFVAATQVVQQIPDDVKAAIYGATAIKIAGPVSHSDANILAREMYTTPDFIRSMESVEGSHAYWAVNVAPSKKAYKVRVPYGALEGMEKQRGGIETMPPSQPAYASAGVDQTSKTLPHSQQNTSNPPISDIDLVVTTARRLESLIETHLQGRGRGLTEKIASVQDKLPSHLIRPAYYVATMRNKTLHRDGFNLRANARANFIRRAALIEEYLLQTHERPSKKSEPAHPTVTTTLSQPTDDDHIQPMHE